MADHVSDPTEAELVLQPDFWELHGKRIMLGVGAVVLAIVAMGAWALMQHKAVARAAKDFAAASSEEQLRAVISNHTDSVVAGNARLLLAEDLREAGKGEEALTLLQELLDQKPDHPLAAVATLALGETNAALGKYEEAAVKYEQVQTRFASSFAAPLAMLGRAQAMVALGRTEDARRLAEAVKVEHANSIAAMQADQLLSTLPKPSVDAEAAPKDEAEAQPKVESPGQPSAEAKPAEQAAPAGAATPTASPAAAE